MFLKVCSHFNSITLTLSKLDNDTSQKEMGAQIKKKAERLTYNSFSYAQLRDLFDVT